MTERVLNLLLVDADQVFRLGLRFWLERFADLEVVAEANSQAAVLEILAGPGRQEALEPDTEADLPMAAPPPPKLDLVILDLDLGASDQDQGLSLCQQIKAQQATLPILLLTARQDIGSLMAAFDLGVEGYCLKGLEAATLVEVIRQVAAGQKYWEPELQALILESRELERQSSTENIATLPSPSRPSIRLRYNLWVSGMQEMETVLASLNAQLQIPTLSWFERAFVAGRRREILAARWLVTLLLAPTAPNATNAAEPPGAIPANLSQMLAESETDQPRAISSSSGSSLLYPGSAGLETRFRRLKSTLFEATLTKLQTSLQNLTGQPLEIDILKQEKKRELFYIILRKFEDILDELRFSQVTSVQLAEKRDKILQDLWREVTADFFGKYYTLLLQKRSAKEVVQEVEIVTALLREAEVVQAAILNKIPLVVELLDYLLFQTPLVVDNHSFPVGSAAAMRQAEVLLQNLLIQVANGVIQPLLNHFADVEVIKQNFYNRRLISTREIERFRNSLSWKYRVRRYLIEPTEIFESQFGLLVLGDRGLEKYAIYAPRDPELKQLTGVRFAVTLALETRDAVSPPLRSAIAFVGKGVVYVLTQVIGRGIGLIGRGVVQGVGSSWQDIRYSRKGQQQK